MKARKVQICEDYHHIVVVAVTNERKLMAERKSDCALRVFLNMCNLSTTEFGRELGQPCKFEHLTIKRWTEHANASLIYPLNRSVTPGEFDDLPLSRGFRYSSDKPKLQQVAA
jgi:hypothetical protein